MIQYDNILICFNESIFY